MYSFTLISIGFYFMNGIASFPYSKNYNAREKRLIVNDFTPQLFVCKNTINASANGTFSSPVSNQSTTYPPNAICTWLLSAPPGKTIHLQFLSFDLENSLRCQADYIRMYDGVDAFSQLLAQFCGHLIPNDVVSTGTTMLVQFHSNQRHEYKGFTILYSVDDKLPAVADQYKDDGCHGDIKYLNASRGYISSPGYDGHTPYGHNLYCQWLVEAPPEKVLRLVFHDFTTEKIYGCTNDYLAIYDGHSNSSSKLDQLCGLQFPNDVITSGNFAFLHFASDDDVAGAGFNLTYEVSDRAGLCMSYQCGDGTCIPYEMVCNNVQECHDGTDEILCGDLTCGRPAISPLEVNQKIVGGREAVEHSWPWMVSLKVNGSHICGGAIIHENWVLTAAHCFEANRHTVEWTAVVGKHQKEKYESTQQTRNVQKIIVHSQYNYLSTINDIAIVKVDTQFNFNVNVNKVCLPVKPPIPGNFGFVTGWGDILGTCCPDVLKQVMLPVINTSVCTQPDHLGGNQVTDNMFCAGYENGGQDTCQGDSGGPFVTKDEHVWHIHGVTSFGTLCAAPKSPGVYTKVYNYVTWIRQHIAENRT